MAVSGIESAQSQTIQAVTSQSKDVMGKDQFMKLLVAQLQHQDPMNPMDSTGFTAQLAQFSSLEQLQNVNSNLTSIYASQASLSNAQAVSFIGKTVTSTGAEFEVRNGVADTINFDLAGDAKAVKIGVYNSIGEYVGSIDAGQMNAGAQSVKWDGLNLNETKVPDGKYQFEVMAVNTDNEAVRVTTYSSGLVTGVNFKDGVPYLLANQLEIPLGSVVSVAESVENE